MGKAGWAAKYPSADLGNPEQFRDALRNIRAVHDLTPPDFREKYKHWYEDVNEGVARGVRGTSTTARQGAGLVAAVSPSMDFDTHNIQAFHELHRLRENDWDTIVRSASAPGGRSSEVSALLRGTSLSRASDANLIRAHRIMNEEVDPEVALDEETAPKTHAFFRNINEPGTSGPVTIDGRANDIATNRMIPWEAERGLTSSPPSQRGTPQPRTRYELTADAYRKSAQYLNRRGFSYLPHQVQAVTWGGGKDIERAGLTKRGTPRRRGQVRVGQSYIPGRGRAR